MQLDGVAMGSSLGPILADIFVAQLEQNVRQQLDDTFLFTVDIRM